MATDAENIEELQRQVSRQGALIDALYRHLGIDPATTLPDHAGRPMHLLDDRTPVRELHS